MKKLFTIAVVAVTMLFAANANAQVGVHLGYSPDKWMNETDTANFHSYVFGIDFLIPIAGDLNITVGVQGRWSTESGDNSFLVIDSNHTTNVVGVAIPVLVNYRFRITEDFSITPFAGPKFSYFIRGRSRTSSGHPIDEWFEEKGNRQKNRFNISATAGVAVGYQQFHLYGGYNFGFSDMDQFDNKKTTVGGPFIGLAIGF